MDIRGGRSNRLPTPAPEPLTPFGFRACTTRSSSQKESRETALACTRAQRVVHGAPGGNRTPNPQLRRLVLYPLSYGRTRLIILRDPGPGTRDQVEHSIVSVSCARSVYERTKGEPAVASTHRSPAFRIGLFASSAHVQQRVDQKVFHRVAASGCPVPGPIVFCQAGG